MSGSSAVQPVSYYGKGINMKSSRIVSDQGYRSTGGREYVQSVGVDSAVSPELRSGEGAPESGT
eukprot:8366473-Alexandrium_andersonii.AAC.1